MRGFVFIMRVIMRGVGVWGVKGIYYEGVCVCPDMSDVC